MAVYSNFLLCFAGSNFFSYQQSIIKSHLPMLTHLLDMTRTLGQPELDYVIIGEGNTSWRDSADTFWVKASGFGMRAITEQGFVQLRIEAVLDLLDSDVDNEAMTRAVAAARVDPQSSVKPSVEATFHAMLLHECDVPFVGHTHPSAVNMILCGSRAEQFAKNRIFPDQAVLCGPESVYVPYADPGLPLAVAIRVGVRDYIARYNEAPKVILMQNHGLIALGRTPTEVLNVTAMSVKSARIFAGTCAISEPQFMSREDIMHIYKRPDEIFRRKLFVEG
jgi:rhamnose utilization protein RhaD (predicted bifunctional aldolase and dehydrogenase)